MEIKKLVLEDADAFCKIILDMYSTLENIEWFSPMPFDKENVEGIITNPRFYVIGAFEEDVLCGACCFDYKCGKLIGKIDFPKECNTEKLVEIGFSIVHSAYRGHGIMKQMVDFLLNEAKRQGFEWIFGKVHKDNFASSKSFLKNGFYKCLSFDKKVKVADIKGLLADKVLSKQATEKIEKKLKTLSKDEEIFYVDYDILIKKL